MVDLEDVQSPVKESLSAVSPHGLLTYCALVDNERKSLVELIFTQSLTIKCKLSQWTQWIIISPT